MAQYHFAVVPSRIVNALILLGYIGTLVLAAASIYYEPWLIVSALVLFSMSFDAERRDSERITACNENGSALNDAGHAIQLCPPMIISPWLIMVRVRMVRVNSIELTKQKTAPARWCRIWRDQLPINDWARIRRIGITLNAPLRRR